MKNFCNSIEIHGVFVYNNIIYWVFMLFYGIAPVNKERIHING